MKLRIARRWVSVEGTVDIPDDALAITIECDPHVIGCVYISWLEKVEEAGS